MFFTTSVAILVDFEQAETLEPHLSAMDSVVKYCTKTGLRRQLHKELKSVDIIGQYELFVRSAPWKRHPATLTLKKIYAFLTVLLFYLLVLY